KPMCAIVSPMVSRPKAGAPITSAPSASARCPDPGATTPPLRRSSMQSSQEAPDGSEHRLLRAVPAEGPGAHRQPGPIAGTAHTAEGHDGCDQPDQEPRPPA